ncbi:MAG: MmgE/PrpD family protein, partial [Burkholderiales bacterium]|nr:MmgE/PrpD family protein [Burkholderiales bacterium]
MPGLTEGITRFIRDKSLDNCPPDAVDKAKKVIADTVAVILAGAGSEVAPPLLAYLRLSGESGTSPILGTAATGSAEMAALVNGTFGHALDFDDVLSMMPAHPSAVIFAALCADLAVRPLSGRAMIEAHVMGVEVGGKIGLGIAKGHYDRGFHGTGTLGIFCAVAALARAYRLDVPATRTAFGIAASMAGGLRCNFGTMTKPLHTGWAARGALAAVRLALSGFTAAPDALEAKSGFYAAYGTDESDPVTTLSGLGNPWVVTNPGVALKKFPCCYASHRGMDGVLALRAKHGFTADDVIRLECRMPPGGMQVLTYPDPKTGLEAKFSLQYALAAGILDGRYTLWSFTDEAVRREEVRKLLPRVAAFEDAGCRGDDPLFDTRSSGSRGFVEVGVELANSVKDTVRIDRPPGHP